MNMADYIPGLREGGKLFPQNLIYPGTPLETGSVWFVDGDKSTGGGGKTWEDAFATLVAAEAAASAGDVIYVAGKTMTADDDDPEPYTENLTINTPQLSIIGVSRGRTNGGLPQIKVGATTTSPIIAVSAPGCLIANLTINGAGATGGGIKLAQTESTNWVHSTTIANCYFRNAKSSGNASTGGAIYVASGDSCPWQVLIQDCDFFNCRAGIVIGASPATKGQDWLMDNLTFRSTVNTNVDADIYFGTAALEGMIIRNSSFQTVDIPGYATSPAAARYIYFGTGVEGQVDNCGFACVSEGGSAKTFGASGDAGVVPTTVRMTRCYGESATADTSGEIFRTSA